MASVLSRSRPALSSLATSPTLSTLPLTLYVFFTLLHHATGDRTACCSHGLVAMELETLVRLVRRQEGTVKAWLVLVEERGVILTHSEGIFGGALVGRFLGHVDVTSMSDPAVLAVIQARASSLSSLETREIARALSLSSPETTQETSESIPVPLAGDERELSRSTRLRRATALPLSSLETSESVLPLFSLNTSNCARAFPLSSPKTRRRPQLRR